MLSLAAATAGTAQDRRTTEVQVTGHVYEPAKLEPTDGRVSALKLPAGFGVTKFAEFSNPRMIAVAEDGTVYVTQREPGTPVAITRHQPGRGRRRAGGGRRLVCMPSVLPVEHLRVRTSRGSSYVLPLAADRRLPF